MKNGPVEGWAVVHRVFLRSPTLRHELCEKRCRLLMSGVSIRLSDLLSALQMLHTATFAKAIFAMHEAGVLREPACKPAVKLLIRQVSEDRHWHFSAHYRSKLAAAKIREGKPKTIAQYQEYCRKNLRHEHMVPGEVVYRLLIGMKTPTVDKIALLLEKTSYRATITKEEDKSLLRDSMPSKLGDPEQGWFPDHLERYRAADNMHLRLEKRPVDGWR